MDICSYRMPCKTILGDRSFIITQKRFNSKVKMLDVYKEVVKEQGDLKKSSKENITDKSIFDIDNELNQS